MLISMNSQVDIYTKTKNEEGDIALKKFLVAFLIAILYVSVAYADISPTIKTTKLPNGKALWHYSEQLSANGTTPIKWILIGGELPNGLGLSEEGLISGTPQRKETTHFVVKASNDVGYAAQQLSLTIDEEPVSGALSSGGCNISYFGVFALMLMVAFITKRACG